MPTLKEAMNDPDAIQRALEAAHRDQQAMKATPTNKDEEPRNLVERIWNGGMLNECGSRSSDKIIQRIDEYVEEIEAYANTKVAEVLDRIEKEASEYMSGDEQGDPIYEDLIPLSAIQAERAKLIQEEGSDE